MSDGSPLTPLSPVYPAMREDDTRSPAELVGAYAAGPGQLRAALAGLNAEQLRARPVVGKWSTLEVLCHLADCEQFFADRMKRTLAMERPLLLGADGFRYPVPLHYQERDVEEELALIAITRAQMARILTRQDPQAWSREAIHSEIGLVTLRQLVQHAINHQHDHVKHIQDKRRALGLVIPEK